MMKNLHLVVVVALAVSSLAGQARAAQGSATATARVDQLAKDIVEVAKLPALSIAILEPRSPLESEPGESGEILDVVYQQAFGFADIDKQVEATVETRFRAASVSKVVTATALARMVEGGVISWDTKLESLDLEFPNGQGITPRLLSGHLAGIGHYGPQDKIKRWEQVASATEALSAFKDSPRVGALGGQYQYSTHGMTLLSAMMEAVAETTFPEIVSATVTKPLGLVHTGPAPAEQGVENMATLYMMLPMGPRAIPKPENPSYKWAGGGFASTPTDLVLLGRAYLESWSGSQQVSAGDLLGKQSSTPEQTRFLSRKTVETMWTPQEVEGKSTTVGVAWRIGEESAGRKIVHHAGSMQGARSVLMLFPNESRAIALMTNSSWDSDIERTAAFLMDAWRSGSASTPLHDSESGIEGAPLRSISQLYTAQLAESAEGVRSREGSETASEAAPIFEQGVGSATVVSASLSASDLQTPITVTGLASPPGFEKVSRVPSGEFRLHQISGERWVAVTPKGLANGTCFASKAGDFACEFQVARALDLLVSIKPSDSGAE